MIRMDTPYVDREGRLTKAGYDALRSVDTLAVSVAALQAQMALIHAVAAPTGGATIDSQSRTAINAIIAAAT